MWALAFIEIRPAGSPASLGAPLSTQPGLQVQVVYLSWSRLQGHGEASIFFFCPSLRTSSSLPLSFPKTGPGSGAGHRQVSPSGGSTGGAEPFLSGPASSATSWIIFPLLS